MSRAAGRAQSRRTPKAPAPGSPQGREIGLDDRDIPSGLHHLVQESPRDIIPAVPETPPYFRGDMAHGVPAEHDKIVRPDDKLEPGHEARKHGSQPVHYELPSPEPDPLPVYIVEKKEKIPKRREAITRVVSVAAFGGEPTRICSEDRERVSIRMFNEAASTGTTIRVGNTQAAVAGVTATAPGDGIALVGQIWSPKLETQGELWGVAMATSAQTMSMVIETEVND